VSLVPVPVPATHPAVHAQAAHHVVTHHKGLSGFFDAVGSFFSDIASVHWGALIIACLFFGTNLSLRARVFFHALRAAYPAQRIEFRRVWGAYFAAVGFNNVVPVRGGDVIKLFLVRSSIPDSTFATCYAAFFCESVFDACMGVITLIFAFTQGVFPKPPDLGKIDALDVGYLISHFRLTLFLFTVLGVVGVALFAFLSVRVKAFWARVRQGFTILTDRRRYFREVFWWQVAAWLFRFASFWFFMEAFRIHPSVYRVLLAFGIGQVAGAVPFTPGGAGISQALYVKVFGMFKGLSPATVVAYSVGQQIAISAFTFAVGFVALVTIFRFRSFREVLRAGRAAKAEEEAQQKAGGKGDASWDAAAAERSRPVIAGTPSRDRPPPPPRRRRDR
jgi:uncharacterized membrane protein YbhN (UPF0104 family)